MRADFVWWVNPGRVAYLRHAQSTLIPRSDWVREANSQELPKPMRGGRRASARGCHPHQTNSRPRPRYRVGGSRLWRPAKPRAHRASDSDPRGRANNGSLALEAGAAAQPISLDKGFQSCSGDCGSDRTRGLLRQRRSIDSTIDVTWWGSAAKVRSPSMAWDDDLEGVHRQIAESDHARIAVLAGPGTGKTTFGLIRRAARLLETGGCTPRQILFVTFTRTAAHDLKEKLAALGSPGVDQIIAGTLHGYCLGLLQREAVLAITGRTPRMLLEHEWNLMLRDLGPTHGTMAERETKLLAMEAGWARQAADHPGAAVDANDVSFQAESVKWLKHHRAMLIGEVVPIAYSYLTNNPADPELAAFRHVIVDEYQDLNTLEHHLADLLAAQSNLCVAGDDDQSIYRFRYAHPEGILLIHAQDTTEPYEITVCGRCPKPILAAANRLMESAPNRNKAPLTSNKEATGSFSIVQWQTLTDEIEGIVAAVAGDVQKETKEAGDFLILVQRRKIGYRMRDALVAGGVTARSFFHEDAMRQSSVSQEGLALLRLLVNPNDRPSLRVLLGLYDADGRAVAYGRLRALAQETNLSEWETLEAVVSGAAKLPGWALKERFEEATARLAQIGNLETPDLIANLFPPHDDDCKAMRELAESLVSQCENRAELLDELLRALTQPDVPQSPDFVRVMSLHKSKGLTSPVVIIAAAVDGILPTVRQTLTEAEQEEVRNEARRLFYVAVTRASEELVVSCSLWMPLADAKGMGIVSGGIRRRDGQLMMKTVACPYVAELSPAAPNAIRGEIWLQGKG
jgi:ATP-dependent DNA helicase UvrD/PcrA